MFLGDQSVKVIEEVLYCFLCGVWVVFWVLLCSGFYDRDRCFFSSQIYCYCGVFCSVSDHYVVRVGFEVGFCLIVDVFVH